MYRSTQSFAVLEVSVQTFVDVRRRLEKAGVLGDYVSSEDNLIQFGGIALKSEPERDLELVPVPVYDGPGLALPVLQALNDSPWTRVDGAQRTLDHEIAGIFIGFALVFTHRENTIDEVTLRQAMAEVKNLILLNGGKLSPSPKTNLQEGA